MADTPDLAAAIAAVQFEIDGWEKPERLAVAGANHRTALRLAQRVLEALADHQFVEDEMITAMDTDDMASAFVAALLSRAGGAR